MLSICNWAIYSNYFAYFSAPAVTTSQEAETDAELRALAKKAGDKSTGRYSFVICVKAL